MTIQELENFSPSNCFYDLKSQLKNFIYNHSEKAFEAGDAARDALKSRDELELRNSYMRKRFVESIGGLPCTEAPLNPVIKGKVQFDGFRMEKVIYESRPGVFVTANLYIPHGITEPTGAVLFLCGHHMQAKHQDEYQIVCQYLVHTGLVVLAQDPVGQGERFGYYEKSIGNATIDWGTIEHDYAGNQCYPLGDSIARYFVHDAMRGIDYLYTRAEVDPARIGVTGNSGGGTQTSLMMICDTRIAAAAPATFIMNRRTFMYAGVAQDSEQIWPGMTALGFDHEDILMLMAPRPVLVLAATSDGFPIEGTRSTTKRTRRFWEMYGKADNLELFEEDCGHQYARPMAKAAARFFAFHLLGKRVMPEDSSVKDTEPSLLWCTKSGQVRGELEGARFVHDENLDRLDEVKKLYDTIPETECRDKAFEWLKNVVYFNRKPCGLNPRHIADMQYDELMVKASIWWVQEGIFNYGLTFRHFKYEKKSLPVTIAVWDGGTTCMQPHLDWIRRTCDSGRAVIVLDTSGAGNILTAMPEGFPALDFYGGIFKLNRDLMWLGDSLAAMRIYDVLRAVEAVQLFPWVKKEDIRFYAHGRQGLYARLAAFLDSRVMGVEVVSGMKSFAEFVRARYYDRYDISSVILPGVLKYFDLPDIERWTGRK